MQREKQISESKLRELVQLKLNFGASDGDLTPPEADKAGLT